MDDRTDAAAQPVGSKGFTLVETLFALLIMSFGMLAIAQLMFVTLSGPTLARSKSTAAIVANDRFRFLAGRYRVNPDDVDLTLGAHGPNFVAIQNPNGGRTMNRFRVDWTVANVPDPRGWVSLHAKLISIRVTPVRDDGSDNRRASLNKVLNMTGLVSARLE